MDGRPGLRLKHDALLPVGRTPEKLEAIFLGN
jgi:hypothetical protein